MLNMIKLDWLGMKCYQKRFVILPLTICAYGLLHEAVILLFTVFLVNSFSTNPFAVEEKGQLDHLYLTLPVTRAKIVNARFGLALIMQAVGLVIGTALTLVYSALLYGRTVLYVFPHNFKADFDTMFLLISGCLLFFAVMNLSTFPVLFKIGYAKGKLLGLVIPVVAASAIGGVFVTMWNVNAAFQGWVSSVLAWAFAHTVAAAAVALAAAAAVLALSYGLSRWFFAKREF